ncbi:MAG: KH domain-containing protein [Clostridiales bacterium]|nr:KH domain-containing protein [Clostridiales bacterium]
MFELVDFLVKQIIPAQSYEIVIIEDCDKVDIRVMVDKDYVAQVIGHSGKTAKAIRTLVRAASQNMDQKYSVYVEER